MIYEELTSKILEACFEVSNELGVGFLESVYEKALLVALRQKGFEVESQVSLKVTFRGFTFGDFFADVVVGGKILIELKAVDSLSKQHYAQVLNYLKATGIEVGLIVNFGNPRLEYRRFENRFNQTPSMDDALRELLGE